MSPIGLRGRGPRLTTRTRLALARALHALVMAPRRVVGGGPFLTARRGGIRWRLDLREGIDLAIYLFGGFERSTAAAYRRLVRPGDTVLDLGANRGAHTLPLARLVGPHGRVVAVEAAEGAFARLLETLELNPELAGRVTPRRALLVRAPVAASRGPVYDSWPVDGRAPAVGTHLLHGGAPGSIAGAPRETLDDAWRSLGRPPVSFVKLDLDGHEPAVLCGAGELLGACRPTLLLEYAPYGSVELGEPADALASVLEAAGYALFTLDGRPVADPTTLAPRPGSSVNVIARPSAAERAALA